MMTWRQAQLASAAAPCVCLQQPEQQKALRLEHGRAAGLYISALGTDCTIVSAYMREKLLQQILLQQAPWSANLLLRQATCW